MTQNFNSEPYYDDYDKHKHFYKILFRPSYSLQSRELTQLQTMLLEQVSRMGDHLFKNGTMVIPGELSLDNNINYVKLASSFNSVSVSTFLTSLIGLVIKGGTTGIRAQVLTVVAAATSTDPDTIYVKYLDGGTAGTVKVFANNETIAPEDTGTYPGLSVQSATSAATGIGSSASIKEGVYYINGYFVLCEPQLIILDKYTNTPTYGVGFTITESIVTPETDETLLDNAQGSYNFAAPGAHRYSIYLGLTKKTNINDVNDADDFIQLVSLINGAPQNVYNQTQYAELAKVMARRTYDESGDYVVKDFKYAVREHRNNSRGAWATGVTYIIGDITTNGGNIYAATTSATSGSGAGSWPTDELTEFDDGGVKWRFTSTPAYNGGVYTPAQGGLEDHVALAIEPGKAYVRGYEVEKVAASFIPISKARTFEAEAFGSVDTIVGNYVLVTNIHAFPDLSKLPTVSLYSGMTTTLGLPSTHGVKVGTARARYFELHSGTIGTTTAIYKVGLFNIKLNVGVDFSNDVKQIYIDAGMSGTTEDFTADVNPTLTPLAGTVTVVGSTGVVTGTGTAFMALRLEDVISVNNKLYRVTVRTSNSLITVAASPDTVVDQVLGVAYYVVSTAIVEPQNSNLIFPVHPYLRSMRDPSNVNQIHYTASEVFAGTTNSSGLITFNTAGTNTFASPAIIGNYVLTYGDGLVLPFAGDGVNPPVALTNSNKTVTITTGQNNTYVRVIIACNKMGSVNTEKSKVLSYASYAVTTSAIGTARVIKLPKADGVKVFSVKMKTGDWTTPTGTYGIDITNRFTFDGGQNDSFYDLSSITLSDGQQAPIAPFQVIYSYFDHSSTGDYFTINSYGTRYASMLSDCLDFRPRISDDGVSFTGTGASVSYMPKRGYSVTSEYTYYIARIDKLCVEPSGDFHLIDGTPSISPIAPETSSTGMLLNTITFAPYTSTIAEVKLEGVDNRRYTMRDIGKLENRINNLEYYTALTLSEQGATNMSITDADGLNRYKNGFIVDSFNGHGIGDASSFDYRCSVDSENKTLRPFHVMKNVALYETDTNNRTSNNYTMTGDLITLPYTHVSMVTQSFASRVENVNPFAVFTFVGMLDINPQSDDWFEADHLPDIVTNVEGNYNTLLKQVTASGALGTIWNAWQTTWTGVPLKTGTSSTVATTGGVRTNWWNNWYGYGYGYGGYYGYSMEQGGGWYGWYGWRSAKTTTTTTTNTFATQIGQTRTGTNTSVSPRIDMEQVGDKVVSKVVIPYMRSRNMAFVAQGMKSGTKLYSQFDGVGVDAYVTPATKITLNNVNGFTNIYDFSSNAGSNSTLASRKIGDNLDLALNKGFIIKGQTSNATAVVLYQEPLVTGAAFTKLHIINIIGTFQINETVIGSLNGGTTGPHGTVATVPTTVAKGADLVTNYAGVACGVFTIPNTPEVKFRTGDREFTLKDTSTGTASTNSSAMYHAVGILDESQRTFIATRNASVVQTKVTDNQIITNNSSTTSSSSSTTPACWYDPLAQTFLVDSDGGVFITKVDLFFFAKETILSTPVRIEIREVSNGMPANKVAPFSTVYKHPPEVNVSTTGATPTTFTFPSPVYLNDGREYALVIVSDSNNYKVFISQMGEIDVATNKVISKQPTLGVLFKSSNGSTWTPDQLQDLKFTMYRALFNTVVTGNVNMCSCPVDSSALNTDPFNVTSGSLIVRVSHPDHQMPVGSKVEISGAVGVANVSSGELNGQHVIANVDQDSYTFTCTTSPTSTAIGGGSAVIASENAQYDTLQVNTSELTFQNTTVSYQIKTTTGQSIDGSETAYVKDASFKTFQANHNVDFAAPRMIASTLNETYLMSSAKSMEVLIIMNSSNDTVSPVIDIQRMSGVLVNNKLNNPTLGNTNVSVIDDRAIVAVANKIAFSNTYSSIYTAIANTTEYNALQTLAPGKYVSIASSGSTANSGDKLVIGNSVQGTDYHVVLSSAITTEATSAAVITIKQHQRFIDEICPMYGTAYNKYVSREIILTQPSSYLKIKVAANIPPLANVDIYYRTNPIGASDPIMTLNWIKATPNKTPVKSMTNEYSDVDIDITDIPSFDTMQVKIVLTSSSTAQVPSCKDLRIIACA